MPLPAVAARQPAGMLGVGVQLVGVFISVVAYVAQEVEKSEAMSRVAPLSV